MNTSILSNEKIELKYIRICEGSIRVKIERGDQIVVEHFAIRKFPSLLVALNAAVAWRDKKHMELFGYPVPEKIIHLVPRKNRKNPVNPETGEDLPTLIPGLSYGFHSGKLRYIVVSQQVNGKPKRYRFCIAKMGLEAAISEATSRRLADLFVTEKGSGIKIIDSE